MQAINLNKCKPGADKMPVQTYLLSEKHLEVVHLRKQSRAQMYKKFCAHRHMMMSFLPRAPSRSCESGEYKPGFTGLVFVKEKGGCGQYILIWLSTDSGPKEI